MRYVHYHRDADSARQWLAQMGWSPKSDVFFSRRRRTSTVRDNGDTVFYLYDLAYILDAHIAREHSCVAIEYDTAESGEIPTEEDPETGEIKPISPVWPIPKRDPRRK